MAKKTFEVEPLDIEKLIKVNDLKEITNPVFFNKFGHPTSDGLLSNEIFGITKNSRAETFAYIDLGEYFINPTFYKAWCRVDSKIPACVYQTDKFKINSSEGKLELDPNGSNGVDFLRKNIDKFHWKENESFAHNQDVQYLKKYKNLIFTKYCPVIPAYYRDVMIDGGRASIEGINKLYNPLLIAVKSLKESADYDLTLSGAIRGRIQECLLAIYNWFAEEPQLGRKFGILRRASMAKTTDYSSRLVMTAPNLCVENIEDLNIDCEHAAIPMSSLCINFFPFVLFHMRRFFENEFSGGRLIAHDDGKYYTPDNYMVNFSDNELKKQIDRFVHGYSNRFIPIEVPVKERKNPINVKFKGINISGEEAIQYSKGLVTIDNLRSSSIIDRLFTWCDVIFIAVTEAIKGKTVLITRYPMDSYYNQVPMYPNVSSTSETESIILNGKLYPKYPRIRQEDIGKDTSNSFIDTMNLNNIFLKSVGGDYDGDTCSVKGIYSDEANDEIKQYMNKPARYIGLDGNLAIIHHAQAVDSIYALTISAPDMKKLTDPEF